MLVKKLVTLIILLNIPFGLTANIAAAGNVGELVTTPERSKLVSHAKRQLMFEENRGQTDARARFIARTPGYQASLADDEMVFRLKYQNDGATNESKPADSRSPIGFDTLRMKFANGTARRVTAASELVTKTNYYRSRNRIENVPNFGRVNYEGIYDGIDAVFYEAPSGALEYDFNVAPEADPSQISIKLEGAKEVRIDERGDLLIATANTKLVQAKPFAYQIVGGEKREVPATYAIGGHSDLLAREFEVSFALGDYDRSLPLVIDPVINYSSFVGGSAADVADAIKVDAAGNAFVVGITSSLDFPAPNTRDGNDFAVFVSKIAPDGASLLYTTILDGESNDGIAVSFDINFKRNDIAIDAAGNAYIAGLTDSRDFPVTDDAYQTTLQCERQFGGCLITEEGFVTKLNAQGAIVYSTFLGGKQIDFAGGIAVDSSGRAYVTGKTQSGLTFPTKNAFQGAGIFSSEDDAYLTVFNASGSDIIYSSALGGNNEDLAFDIAVDSSNNVYITGETNSTNFPVKNAAQTTKGSGVDAFVAKFNPFLSGEASLIFSTFLGGNGTERGLGIAVSNNFATVTGVTGSANFPLLNAFDTTNQVNEAFITQYNSTGTMQNSTFLGGAGADEGFDIATPNSTTAIVTGSTLSNDFPLALPFQATRRGQRDAFVAKVRFGAAGTRGVISSSFLGGTGNDQGRGVALRGKSIFLVGSTESSNFTTTAGVLRETSNASAAARDGFITEILDTQLDSVGVFRPSSTFTLTQSISDVVPVNATFTGGLAGDRGVSGDWDGDGIDSTGTFTAGTWKVRNANFPAINLPGVFGAKTIAFGQAGDLPVVGDWNNDGIDTPGVFRPSSGQFLLTNSTSTTPAVELTINFGLNGDLPVAGDWNADGFDSVGVFRPTAGQFFLTDDNVLAASIDQAFFFGLDGDLPVGGDWNGDGIDTVGVFRLSTTEFFLTNDNINFSNVFTFGQINDQPIVGDWDGRAN